jgi:hypothetical protein
MLVCTAAAQGCVDLWAEVHPAEVNDWRGRSCHYKKQWGQCKDFGHFCAATCGTCSAATASSPLPTVPVVAPARARTYNSTFPSARDLLDAPCKICTGSDLNIATAMLPNWRLSQHVRHFRTPMPQPYALIQAGADGGVSTRHSTSSPDPLVDHSWNAASLNSGGETDGPLLESYQVHML